MVRKLERRYDDYMKDNMPDEMLRSPLTDEDGALPSADEIAAELEAFLSARPHHDDGPER